MRIKLTIGAAAIAVTLGTSASGAFAASAIQKECSQKYQEAKSANQLAGQTYNQYYKACAAAAKEGKSETPPAPTPTSTAPAPVPTPAPTTTATKLPPPVTAGPAGAAVFPTALSSSFSTETAGKARMHTCLAQYKANKATNGNGGLKWIEKGGGYYSECNKRRKG